MYTCDASQQYTNFKNYTKTPPHDISNKANRKKPFVGMKVSCGASHSLFLDIHGNLWVVGKNEHGQLGLEPGENVSVPQQVEGSFCGVVAARYSSLALDDAGRVYGTGLNRNGHLGMGSKEKVLGFQQIEGLPIIRFVSCLSYHTLLIDECGNVWVSGRNQNGQLGVGDKFDRETFEQIPDIPPISLVATGLKHSLMLSEEGDVYVMGSNYSSQLGSEKTFSDFTKPTILTGIPKMRSLSTNFFHSAFVDVKNRVWICGQGNDGQLGLGSRVKIRVPTKIPRLLNIVNVSAGSNYTLALDNDGKAWLAGNMIHSHRKQISASHRFTQIEITPKVRYFSSAKLHMLFVDEDGGLWGSGSNIDGQLGQGKTVYELRVPALIRNLPPIAFPSEKSSQKSARK